MQNADPAPDLNWADYIDELQSGDPVGWSPIRHRPTWPLSIPTIRRPDSTGGGFANHDGEGLRGERREDNRR